MRSRAAVIASILRHIQIPVRRILDAGCGLGLLRGPLADLYPRARYSGLESSPYLCARFGWILGSVMDFAPSKPFDLTICYDVLQYLPDAQAARAIANFARLTRAALYVSALTAEDWRNNCDRSRTDRAVHLRPGAWYRRRLQRSFRYVGVRCVAAQGRDGNPLGHGAALKARYRYRLCMQPRHQRRMHGLGGAIVRANVIHQ